MKTRLKNLSRRIRNKLETTRDRTGIQTVAVCAAQVPFFHGGAEAHVQALIEHLRVRGYEVELINLPYKWYPHDQLLKSIEIWKMLDLSESNGKKIDLVIATKFPSYFVNHPRKVLWLIHQYRQMYDLLDSPYSGFDLNKRKDKELRDNLVAWDTEALASFPRRFSNSQNTAARLKKYNDLDAVPLYHPPRLVGRYQNLGYEDTILSVGRLDKLKRIDLLLKALPYIDTRIRCKIAGSGPEGGALQALAQDLGIADRVDFLGYVPDDDLLQLYGLCSAVFFAPQDEDFGYITLEAYLSQKPVITGFDSGGPLEFVVHGKNGIVFENFEPKMMAQEIVDLVLDKARCEAFGRAGFEGVSHIGWDPVIQALIGENS
ncbi:MAG: glycosyltransferase [Candidatus Aminicenantes bacterium]|nr:glycosyltransferase [Candidatus Aminicenantes bacterium]